MPIQNRRWLFLAPLILALAALAALATTACGGNDAPAAAPLDYGAAFTNDLWQEAHDSLDATPAADTAPVQISLMLDWLPNTNHTGLFVAQANGWYAEQGITLKILPYSGASGDVLAAERTVDVAVSFPTSMAFSRAAGLDLVSIAAVLQHNPTEVAVLASGPIERPRDMDGKTYAGFGLPYEVPQMTALIRADGGQGEIQHVVLNTAAYEALYAGAADIAETFVTWEGIEARQRGVALRTFPYAAFGIPDFPGVVLAVGRETLEAKRDALVRFLRATIRGYEFAITNPREAAQILIDAAGADVFPNTELVFESAALIAAEYYADGEGRWGSQTEQQWTGYPRWLYDHGLLIGPDGEPLGAAPADTD